MDDYLTEKEQIEQIREWWRENGWYLVGGALVAGLGYLGYGQYQAYQDRQAEAASALYAELRQALEEDRPGAEDLLAELADDYGSSPYTDQARLLMAREFLVSDTDRAADELRTVMETSDDPGLAMVARLRLARVLAYQGQYDEALALLEVQTPGEFSAQIKAIEGDIHVARGAPDDARRAYTDALTSQGAAGLDRNLLQMKLGELPAPDVELLDSADTTAPSDDGPPAEAPAAAAPTDRPVEATADDSAATGARPAAGADAPQIQEPQ